MKLWDKGTPIDKQIEQFTVGNDREVDIHIAKYDIKASYAHAKMLQSIGILTETFGGAAGARTIGDGVDVGGDVPNPIARI